MARTTKLMTSTEVKTQAVDQPIDENLFDRYILPSQRSYVLPLLGEDFYEEMTTQVENSTLTADNSTLLNEYIKPMLAHYVVYDALPQLHAQVNSRGVFMNISETSEPVSASMFNVLRQNYLHMAERLERDVKHYIDEEQEDDSSKFPDYDACNQTNHNKYRFL